MSARAETIWGDFVDSESSDSLWVSESPKMSKSDSKLRRCSELSTFKKEWKGEEPRDGGVEGEPAV